MNTKAHKLVSVPHMVSYMLKMSAFNENTLAIGGGGGGANIPCAPTSGGTLGKAHYEHCSTLPACAVLTELRDGDCIKAITEYDALPSTSDESKVFAPLVPPEVLNFKPAHDLWLFIPQIL